MLNELLHQADAPLEIVGVVGVIGVRVERPVLLFNPFGPAFAYLDGKELVLVVDGEDTTLEGLWKSQNLSPVGHGGGGCGDGGVGGKNTLSGGDERRLRR